jgi:hypothetical protein
MIEINVAVGDASLVEASRNQIQVQRLVQLEREREAAFKPQAEAARRQQAQQSLPDGAGQAKRRQLEEPAGTRRGGELGFVLPSGLTFDTSVQGPFAPDYFFSQFSPDQPWGYLNGAFTLKTRGYSNNFATSNEKRYFVINNQPFPIDARPVLSGDGSYQGGFTTFPPQLLGLPENNYSEMYLVHLVAQGSAIRTTVITKSTGSSEKQKVYASGDTLRAVPGSSLSNGMTVEFIVKLASLGPRTGVSGLNAYVNFTKDAYVEEDGNNLAQMSFGVFAGEFLVEYPTYKEVKFLIGNGSTNFDLPNYLISEGFNHFAYVVDARTETMRTYINGKLLSVDPGYPCAELIRARFFEVYLTMQDYNQALFPEPNVMYEALYPGKSSLKALRWTHRALYLGDSFTPPTDLTSLA